MTKELGGTKKMSKKVINLVKIPNLGISLSIVGRNSYYSCLSNCLYFGVI
jgi:hypothetical protein